MSSQKGLSCRWWNVWINGKMPKYHIKCLNRLHTEGIWLELGYWETMELNVLEYLLQNFYDDDSQVQ